MSALRAGGIVIVLHRGTDAYCQGCIVGTKVMNVTSSAMCR